MQQTTLQHKDSGRKLPGDDRLAGLADPPPLLVALARLQLAPVEFSSAPGDLPCGLYGKSPLPQELPYPSPGDYLDRRANDRASWNLRVMGRKGDRLAVELTEEVVAETRDRVALSMGVPGPTYPVDFCDKLPRLDEDGADDLLAALIEHHAAEVVVLDSLYSSLAGPGSAVDMSNLYSVGPRLLRLANTCLRAGATPVFIPHTTKGVRPSRAPIGLTDIAFSGFAESAAQWILLNHRQGFDVERGLAKLVMAYGGRSGHGGVRDLDVFEGKRGDPGGRVFQPKVLPYRAPAQRADDAGGKDKGRRSDPEEQLRKVEKAIDKFNVAVGAEVGQYPLRTAAGLSGTAWNALLPTLAERGILEEVPDRPHRTCRRLR